MPSVLLGLGSNLGERLATLQRAVDLLAGEHVRVVASSRVWETEPIGPTQPDYLNAVVRAQTDLDPLELLSACHRVEASLGRVRAARWGPRTIDIDVLLYDGIAVDEPGLTIPHPRMTVRAFVVLPMLELDPDPVLPDGTRVKDVHLASAADARLFAPPLRLPPA
jgi:2-amino-4-hydroxy-6-hydroxymethyldihydropteridine diphosphokinase